MMAAALNRECLRVASAAQGERNNTLNEAAFRLGALLATHSFDEQEVIERLADASTWAGLVPSEITATIRSGLATGKARMKGKV